MPACILCIGLCIQLLFYIEHVNPLISVSVVTQSEVNLPRLLSSVMADIVLVRKSVWQMQCANVTGIDLSLLCDMESTKMCDCSSSTPPHCYDSHVYVLLSVQCSVLTTALPH
jgi:hypothetical protein